MLAAVSFEGLGMAIIIAVVWVGSSTALGIASAWLLRRATGRRWAWWSVLAAVPV